MIRKLFNGIEKKYYISTLVSIIVWTYCNCVMVDTSANLVSSFANNTVEPVSVIFKYLFLIIVWCTTEYFLDISEEMLYAHIENTTMMQGLNAVYETKPEVIKRNNAGYITGLIRTLHNKRADMIGFIIVEALMFLFYMTYFAIRFIKFHWIFGVIMYAVVIIGTTFRIVGRKVMSKYADRQVEADSIASKVFIDTLSNVNTVQKMQAKKFMSGRL